MAQEEEEALYVPVAASVLLGVALLLRVSVARPVGLSPPPGEALTVPEAPPRREGEVVVVALAVVVAEDVGRALVGVALGLGEKERVGVPVGPSKQLQVTLALCVLERVARAEALELRLCVSQDMAEFESVEAEWGCRCRLTRVERVTKNALAFFPAHPLRAAECSSSRPL